jgi:hypothetical protein
VTPGSSKAVPTDAAIQDTKKRAKGDKKKRKQCPQWATAVADYDGNDERKADGSDMRCVVTTAHSGKH